LPDYQPRPFSKSSAIHYQRNSPILTIGLCFQECPLVEKAGWNDWIDEDDEDVRVVDLGEAFPHGAELINLAEPADLQAPEKILTGNFDYRVDLWRTGCTVIT